MNIGNTGALIALIVAAVASGFLFFRSQAPEPQTSRIPRLGMGYYMNNAELMGTGPAGRALYRVRTKKAVQSLEDGSIEMEAIEMRYNPEAEIPWNLSADHGRIPPDKDIIQLTGDVVVISQVPDEPETTIRTDYLEIDPQTYVAQTERDVAIERDGNTVNATGLRAYLKEDRLQLLSNVNGKFSN